MGRESQIVRGKWFDVNNLCMFSYKLFPSQLFRKKGNRERDIENENIISKSGFRFLEIYIY
jgi:hypothetical protein